MTDTTERNRERVQNSIMIGDREGKETTEWLYPLEDEDAWLILTHPFGEQEAIWSELIDEQRVESLEEVVEYVKSHKDWGGLSSGAESFIRADYLDRIGFLTFDQSIVYLLDENTAPDRREIANVLQKSRSTADTLYSRAEKKVERAKDGLTAMSAEQDAEENIRLNERIDRLESLIHECMWEDVDEDNGILSDIAEIWYDYTPEDADTVTVALRWSDDEQDFVAADDATVEDVELGDGDVRIEVDNVEQHKKINEGNSLDTYWSFSVRTKLVELRAERGEIMTYA